MNHLATTRRAAGSDARAGFVHAAQTSFLVAGISPLVVAAVVLGERPRWHTRAAVA